VLAGLGATRAAVEDAVRGSRPLATGPTLVRVLFEAPTKDVLVLAARTAAERGETDVTSGHLLLGLLRQPGSAATGVLAGLAIGTDQATGAMEARMKRWRRRH
jgi:hypothetical protein